MVSVYQSKTEERKCSVLLFFCDHFFHSLLFANTTCSLKEMTMLLHSQNSILFSFVTSLDSWREIGASSVWLYKYSLIYFLLSLRIMDLSSLETLNLYVSSLVLALDIVVEWIQQFKRWPINCWVLSSCSTEPIINILDILDIISNGLKISLKLLCEITTKELLVVKLCWCIPFLNERIGRYMAF